MADGRTPAACRTSPLVWRPTANGSGSQLFRRDRLHGPHLDPVAAPASPGTWLWLAGDGMAPVERVGQGRGVRAAPSGGAGPAGSGGPVGLVTRERGLGQCARQT